MQSSLKNQSLNPTFHCCDWSDGAALRDWSTARMTARGGVYANVLLHDVQPQQNKIQIPDDSFRRLRTDSFFIDNNFIYRLHKFAESLCSHTVTRHTA